MRVGIIQMNIIKGDKNANKNTVAEKVAAIMRNDCPPQVIVLPELWSTGYDLEHANSLATPFGEDEAIFLGSLARKYHVAFAGGSVLSRYAGKVFNRAQIIDEKGAYAGGYDKIHLFRLMGEERFLAAGKSAFPFTLHGVRCACIICYDLRFCELPRKLAVEGAEILFISAEWPLARKEHWLTLGSGPEPSKIRCSSSPATGAASRNQEQFGGNSMIVAPDGRLLAHAGEEESLLCAGLDLALVRKTREHIRALEDRVPDAYSHEEKNQAM